MDEKQQKKYPFYFYVIAIFLGLSASFFILEIYYFRLFNPQILYDECVNKNISLAIPHDKLGYVLRPNLTVCDYQYDSHKKIAFTTNNAGFRMLSDVNVEKKKNVTRILLLGDSMLQGAGLDDTETIGHKLSRILPKEYEIINMGLSGTGTGQQLLLLKEIGLKYKPDIVILFFYPNDFDDTLLHINNYTFSDDGALNIDLRPLFNTTPPQQRQFFIAFTTKYSHTAAFFYNKYHYLRLQKQDLNNGIISFVYTFFLRTVSRPPNLDSTSSSMTPFYDEIMKTGFYRTLDLFKEFKRLEEKHEFRAIVVTIPHYFQFNNKEFSQSIYSYAGLNGTYLPEKYNILFGIFFHQGKVPYLDLLNEKSFYRDYKDAYFKEDSHLSPYGAQLVAQAVYKKLIIDGYVDAQKMI